MCINCKCVLHYVPGLHHGPLGAGSLGACVLHAMLRCFYASCPCRAATVGRPVSCAQSQTQAPRRRAVSAACPRPRAAKPRPRVVGSPRQLACPAPQSYRRQRMRDRLYPRFLSLPRLKRRRLHHPRQTYTYTHTHTEFYFWKASYREANNIDWAKVFRCITNGVSGYVKEWCNKESVDVRVLSECIQEHTNWRIHCSAIHLCCCFKQRSYDVNNRNIEEQTDLLHLQTLR